MRMTSAGNDRGMNMAEEIEIVLFETEDKEITLNVKSRSGYGMAKQEPDGRFVWQRC